MYDDKLTIEDWHKWYAWHPITTVHQRLIWLKYVWCRRVIGMVDSDFGMVRGWIWEYKE